MHPSPDLERCESEPSLFSTPSTADSTWAALQIWRNEHRGKLVWWRLAVNGPHPDDNFGVELMDTNAQYRRAIVSQIDLRTFPTLRDEIMNIAGAPTWTMSSGIDLSEWADGMDWTGRFERAHRPVDNTTHTDETVMMAPPEDTSCPADSTEGTPQ